MTASMTAADEVAKTPPVKEPAFMSITTAAAVLDMSDSAFRFNLNAGRWPFTALVTKLGGRYKVSRYKLDLYCRGELEEPERG